MVQKLVLKIQAKIIKFISLIINNKILLIINNIKFQSHSLNYTDESYYDLLESKNNIYCKKNCFYKISRLYFITHYNTIFYYAD